MLNVAIKKNLPDFTLDIEFSLERNILVLFGPSGCGKTTILRCIAGLTEPNEGSIIYNDSIFFSSENNSFIPPHKRNIGYMFQDLALFPHMDVSRNILYGAKNKRLDEEEKLGNVLESLKISHLANRTIQQLSGGEKQRVALARSLMAEPNILLLDEPLSSLDTKTRYDVQSELQRIQASWKILFILVTHDLTEAKTLGDEIIFLEKGQISAHEKIRNC